MISNYQFSQITGYNLLVNVMFKASKYKPFLLKLEKALKLQKKRPRKISIHRKRNLTSYNRISHVTLKNDSKTRMPNAAYTVTKQRPSSISYNCIFVDFLPVQE